MNNKIIKIGVIGIGTVGSALINHLKSQVLEQMYLNLILLVLERHTYIKMDYLIVDSHLHFTLQNL